MIAEPLVAPVPVEPTTPIKPSEALRLGRLIAPKQVRGTTISRERSQLVGACALGMIAIGYGMPTDGGFWGTDSWVRFHETVQGDAPRYSCPDGGLPYERGLGHPHWSDSDDHGTRDVEGTIVHLNDDHFWDTDRIGDWLRSIGL